MISFFFVKKSRASKFFLWTLKKCVIVAVVVNDDVAVADADAIVVVANVLVDVVNGDVAVADADAIVVAVVVVAISIVVSVVSSVVLVIVVVAVMLQ